MIRVILGVLLVIFISFGYGIEVNKKLRLNIKGFKGVIGFIVFMALIQIGYYPIQFFNLSFNYVVLVSLSVILFGLFLALKNIKNLINDIFNINAVIVLISVMIFYLINYNLFLDIEFSDASTYLNYIAQNINISNLNMFNPITGVAGSEWDIFYLYQGYYHFGSFFCWLINITAFVFNRGSYVANITVITWGLGLIYSFFSTMFIINIVNYFGGNKKRFINIILAYLLLYANFYYWKIAFAFYGNTYRVIIGSILIFYIYRWFKEENDNLKKMFPIIIFAGLSFTSSFLFISFVIMFVLAVYLYMIKKDKTTYDMFTFVFPIALYGIIMFGKVYHTVLFAGILFLLIIYGVRLLKPVRRIFEEIDEFFFNHIKIIVFIIVPVLLAATQFI